MASEKNETKGMLFFNFLSIVGITLFAVFNFIGMMFFFDGTIGTSLLITLGLTVLLAALLILMCVAKAKDNNISLWRTVEFSALALFIITAGASFFGPVRSLCIMGSKSEIQAAAQADKAAIAALFAEYEEKEKEAITHTQNGLGSCIGKDMQEDLANWCREANLTTGSGSLKQKSINSFADNQRLLLIDGMQNNIKAPAEVTLNSSIGVFESWNIFSMPAQPAILQDLAGETAEALTDLSGKANLPFIENDDYTNEGYISQENQTFTYDAPQMKSAKAISNVGYGKWYAWLILVVMHVLTLCSYFWTQRSRKTSIKEQAITGGSTIL